MIDYADRMRALEENFNALVDKEKQVREFRDVLSAECGRLILLELRAERLLKRCEEFK